MVEISTMLRKNGDGTDEGSFLLPPNYKELYIVITERAHDLEMLANHLEERLSVATNGRSTVLTTNTALGAARIGRNYGHVPVFLVIGDTREGRQGLIASSFFHEIWRRFASFPDARNLEREDDDRFHELVDEIQESNIERALRTVLSHREDQLVRKSIFRKNEPNLDDVIASIEDRYAPLLKWYPSILKTTGLRPAVVKVGGSMYDLTRTTEGGKVFRRLIEMLAQVTNEGEYNLVITVGGGPFYDPTKQLAETLELGNDYVRKMAPRSFRQQALTLAKVFSQYGVAAQLVEDSTLLQTVVSLVKIGGRLPYVPIVLTIPKGYPGMETGVPAWQSDKLTVAVAHLLNEPNAVFVKDAEGIFMRDPNLSYVQVSALPTEFRGPNRQIKRIYAGDVNTKILRVGSDRRDEHLIENSALEFLAKAKVVGSMQLVNGRQPEQIKRAIMGEPVGSYILK